MIIRLYLDEDSMDHDLVRALRARGVDITTPLEAEMMERPDEAHLNYAASAGRVLYSFNMGDYCRLHREFLAAGKNHSGIVVAQQQKLGIGEQMRRLCRLVAERPAGEMVNGLEFLSRWG